MDIESNHSSPVLADPAPINKARLGIHSNLLTYAPSGGPLSSSKYRNIPRKKPGKLDEVCSNACLDAMKSSSPPCKKLIKDGSDTAYSTWMVMLASLLVDSSLEVRHFDLLTEKGFEVDLDAIAALADQNSEVLCLFF
ncbi:hypothetical protein OIU85_000824 [Salix viminalis]|uniref:Uncharacterized protein n=1 Tax=Salix viminalis TaxID=40686 RepID=A0A9Q0ZX51_SALVM|nr:hypothetical protein OIU85_000824 [Salix viminalis]